VAVILYGISFENFVALQAENLTLHFEQRRAQTFSGACFHSSAKVVHFFFRQNLYSYFLSLLK
jgi:hypothetical protein